MEDNSEIKSNEYHPSASHALEWLQIWQLQDIKRWMLMREAIASTALSGNRMAQICNGTLERLDKKEPVSDRYLLGLCWFLKEMYEDSEKE